MIYVELAWEPLKVRLSSMMRGTLHLTMVTDAHWWPDKGAMAPNERRTEDEWWSIESRRIILLIFWMKIWKFQPFIVITLFWKKKKTLCPTLTKLVLILSCCWWPPLLVEIKWFQLFSPLLMWVIWFLFNYIQTEPIKPSRCFQRPNIRLCKIMCFCSVLGSDLYLISEFLKSQWSHLPCAHSV